MKINRILYQSIQTPSRSCLMISFENLHELLMSFTTLYTAVKGLSSLTRLTAN